MVKGTGQKLAASPPILALVAIPSPALLGASTLYGAGTLIWVYVLKTVPLSYACSFMALTFVIVPVLARFWFGEPLNTRHFLGMWLVVSGLATLWS